jgi:hypothetical protein
MAGVRAPAVFLGDGMRVSREGRSELDSMPRDCSRFSALPDVLNGGLRAPL